MQAGIHQGTVKMNPLRFQGKLILEWLTSNIAQQMRHFKKCQGLSRSETDDYFQVCQNVNAISDACLSSVIDQYAKTACQEWASILQTIQDTQQ